MAILQVVAARLADVDKLVYHTFEKQYSDAFRYVFGLLIFRLSKTLSTLRHRQGMALLDELVPNGEQIDVDELVSKLTEKTFKWGFSDGN